MPGVSKKNTIPAPVHFKLCATGLPETGMWKCDPIFGDINGDGHADLAAVPRLGRGPQAWIGDGAGAWTEASEGLRYDNAASCGGGVEFADINKDGKLDLAVADHCHGISVYLGDGAGKWNLAIEGLFPTELAPSNDPDRVQMVRGAEDLDVGDVNRDGHLDIVAVSSDEGGIHVYLGDGTGAKWRRESTSLPSKAWANRVMLRDLNGDNLPDIIANHAEGPRVWLNEGGTGWRSASQGLPAPMVHGIFIGLDVADINKDGRPDIVTANWVDGPEIYIQRADGGWTKQPDVFPQMLGGAAALAVADLDQDGNPDIVTAGRLTTDGGYVRGVYALFGDGNGGMRYSADTGLPATGLAATDGIAVADFNHDNYPDVAAGSGLIVETVPGAATDPVIAPRLITWCASPGKR
jgi:hypothetical protein